jgi:hypothetical protein
MKRRWKVGTLLLLVAACGGEDPPPGDAGGVDGAVDSATPDVAVDTGGAPDVALDAAPADVTADAPVEPDAPMADAAEPDAPAADGPADACVPDPDVVHKLVTPADNSVVIGGARFMFTVIEPFEVTVRRGPPSAPLPNHEQVNGPVYELDRSFDGMVSLPLAAPVPANPVVVAFDAITKDWFSMGGMVEGGAILAATPRGSQQHGGVRRIVTTLAVMPVANVHAPLVPCGGDVVGSWTSDPGWAGDYTQHGTFIVAPPPGTKYQPLAWLSVTFTAQGTYTAQFFRRDEALSRSTHVLDPGTPAGVCGGPAQPPCPAPSCAERARYLSSSTSDFCTIPGQPTSSPLCEAVCVDDWSANGCACSSYGWPRIKTESGTYRISDNQLLLTTTSVTGNPAGLLLPLGGTPERPWSYCRNGDALRFVGVLAKVPQ